MVHSVAWCIRIVHAWANNDGILYLSQYSQSQTIQYINTVYKLSSSQIDFMVNGALCDMLYEYIYLATTYIIMICHVHYCKSTKIYYDIYVKLYRIKLCH